MLRLKKDLALAGLPTPVSLTPDQLTAVVAGALKGLSTTTTTATDILGGKITISGAVPNPPVVLLPGAKF